MDKEKSSQGKAVEDGTMTKRQAEMGVVVKSFWGGRAATSWSWARAEKKKLHQTETLNQVEDAKPPAVEPPSLGCRRYSVLRT